LLTFQIPVNILIIRYFKFKSKRKGSSNIKILLFLLPIFLVSCTIKESGNPNANVQKTKKLDFEVSEIPYENASFTPKDFGNVGYGVIDNFSDLEKDFKFKEDRYSETFFDEKILVYYIHQVNQGLGEYEFLGLKKLKDCNILYLTEKAPLMRTDEDPSNKRIFIEVERKDLDNYNFRLNFARFLTNSDNEDSSILRVKEFSMVNEAIDAHPNFQVGYKSEPTLHEGNSFYLSIKKYSNYPLIIKHVFIENTTLHIITEEMTGGKFEENEFAVFTILNEDIKIEDYDLNLIILDSY